ncbi:MAG: hypothetical protein JOZ39_11600 [Chloroflexi bacterium]|nr:hypothetical protein [Chloroflexota bacterium]
MSEDTVRKVCAVGDAATIVAGVKALAKAGVGQVSFAGPFGLPPDEAIDYLGKEVLPQIRDL